MKRRTFSILLLTLVLQFSPCRCLSQTNTLVVPREAASTFGDRASDLFFLFSSVEQIYGASEFSSLSSDLILITAIAFRVDDAKTLPVDFTLKEIQMAMGTWPDSVQEAVDAGPLNQLVPFKIVVSGTDLHLSGKTGLEFDVRFTFAKPYLYDRRKGQLLLKIFSNGGGEIPVEMNAEGIYNTPGDFGSGFEDPFQRGAIISVTSIGRQLAAPLFTVTQFSFIELQAKFDRITVETNSVCIDYIAALAASGLSATLESAESIGGPFRLETNTQLTSIGPDKTRVSVRTVGKQKFFRLRIQ